MTKAASTRSPLAKPSTLVHRWVNEIQSHLHLPDPSPYYLVLGTLVANMMKGDSVWMILVGGSGVGKTTAIMSLAKCPNVVMADSIDGEASLLSGSSRKDKATDATGGLLFEVGERGLIAIEEFTNVLAQDRVGLEKILSKLRTITKGFMNRPVGSDGGRTIKWKGQIGFIAGCTSAIDRYYRVMGEFGQRWVIYRFPKSDGYSESLKIAGVEDMGEVVAIIQQSTQQLINDLGLKWSCHRECSIKENDPNHECEIGPIKREITKSEARKIAALAAIGARGRAIVSHDKWNREVDGLVDEETISRLHGALVKLLLAFETLGITESESWALLERIAWDTITPSIRTTIIRTLMEAAEADVSMTIGELEDVLQVGPVAIKSVIADLKVLGFVEQPKGTGDVWVGKWIKEKVAVLRK